MALVFRWCHAGLQVFVFALCHALSLRYNRLPACEWMGHVLPLLWGVLRAQVPTTSDAYNVMHQLQRGCIDCLAAAVVCLANDDDGGPSKHSMGSADTEGTASGEVAAAVPSPLIEVVDDDTDTTTASRSRADAYASHLLRMCMDVFCGAPHVDTTSTDLSSPALATVLVGAAPASSPLPLHTRLCAVNVVIRAVTMIQPLANAAKLYATLGHVVSARLCNSIVLPSASLSLRCAGAQVCASCVYACLACLRACIRMAYSITRAQALFTLLFLSKRVVGVSVRDVHDVALRCMKDDAAEVRYQNNPAQQRSNAKMAKPRVLTFS